VAGVSMWPGQGQPVPGFEFDIELDEDENLEADEDIEEEDNEDEEVALVEEPEPRSIAAPQQPTEETDADAESEQPVEEFIIEDGEVPLVSITIGGREFLIFAPMGSSAWSILNVILCALGLLLIALTVVASYAQKRKDQLEAAKMEENPDYELRFISRRKFGWLATMGVAATAGIFLLVVNLDLSLPMVLADSWTAIHTALFAVEGTAMMFVHKKPGETEGSEPSRSPGLQLGVPDIA